MTIMDPWAIPMFDAADDGGGGGMAPEAGDDAVSESQGPAAGEPTGEPAGGDTELTQATTASEQGADPGWLKLFPKEHQNDEFFKAYPNAKEALLDLKQRTQRMKDAIVKPGENATEGEIAEYRRALGVPETPDEYHLPMPEDLPEDFKGDDSWFREMAHRQGLSKQQAENLYTDYYRNVAENFKTQQAERERAQAKATEELQREYGGEYNAKLTLGKRAIQEIGGADFVKYLDETGLGNDPRMIKAAIRMGELIGEDSMVAGRVTSPLPQTANRGEGELALDYSDYFGR